MLRISNLTKTYRNGVKALDDVSLEIGRGMFGLLGPNGAGKSTLMRTIATLQDADQGSIAFNDVNVSHSPVALRRELGYLPQDFGLYPRISAHDLLHHLAVLKGISNRSQRKQQVDALLAKTNLYDVRKRAVSGFSSGMKQRFGIAQALLGDPKLVIVDEPTAGLDPEERNRFHNMLSEIGENIVVLLSTHIVEDVRNLCSEMAILGGGQIILKGQPQQLMNQLDGRIWSGAVDKENIPRYRDHHTVLSTQLFSGVVKVRLLADECPEDGFHREAPSLEDVYFEALSRVGAA